MKRIKDTTTSKVEAALMIATARGDFLSQAMLERITGDTTNQISAALHSLREYRAVDVVIEVDGAGWWFATPDTDQRIRTTAQISEHTKKPGRKRRAGVKK